MSRSELVEVFSLIWPVPVTIVTAVGAIALGVPWVGPLILIPVMLARRLYWSCRLGYFNWIVLLLGIVACVAAAIRQFVLSA
ncbi:MAG TPA: hypothetical protein VGN57_23390 [Pirellulaceae bacterium]|jgi:hypothetical protein|nr:hypothetical protein [Pirellulaceae bacterium]